jgi:hypothetical protein
LNNRLISRLILPSLLLVCLPLVVNQQISHAQSLRPYVIPRVGDFFTYNNSATKPDGSISYTNVVWNLTFASNPSQDFFGVTFQSFYPGPFFPSTSNPPANGSYWLVDVANMIITSTTGFPYITPSDLPMAFPFLLPTNATLGSDIQATSQNPPSYHLTVSDEQNITLYGTTYQCWNASGQSTPTEITNVLFTKSSGIVLYIDKHSSLNFESNVFQILLARVEDYSIVSEFLPIILLPLLIGVSIAVVSFRRKTKRK